MTDKERKKRACISTKFCSASTGGEKLSENRQLGLYQRILPYSMINAFQGVEDGSKNENC